ncbi:exocyst complex component, sec3 subunit [Phlegmacium glaucopus]|nr:exocyst complex component, sec3 subunit [Phlegmacium glaucopus]
MADQRQKIIASVFSKRNASGNLDESYVSHVKIWEDAEGGRKPRYILLSQANSGLGFIHKSKLNTNGTFSVGKTWKLEELRAINVISPLAFNLTLSRTYRWQTENREDQTKFLEDLVRLFRTVTNGQAPLQLDGIQVFNISTADNQTMPRDSRRADHGRSPSNGPGPNTALRKQSPQNTEGSQRNPSPFSNGLPRSGSPASSLRERRPPSIVVPHSATVLPTQQPRRPSIAASTSSHVPSLSVDMNPPRAAPQGSALTRSRFPNRTNSPTPSLTSRSLALQRDYPSTPLDVVANRRDQNARISYFDPSNQATVDRLITGAAETQLDGEGEEENVQATLTNVEEMIEGYEWASENTISRKTTKGAVDLIEARLLDELMALEKANIHSFLESDDRLALVMKCMDEAISELDNMESLISTYKIHLNTVNDDILYIQSQNRGLQVQTQNQRALLGELQNLLRTVHVDEDALATLSQQSLEKSQSIQQLEEAAVQLYKALQAGRDTDMAATMERLQEYRTHNSQFCKRMFDFLSIVFVAQSKLLLGETSGLAKSPESRPTAIPHTDLESYLGRYAGLILYLREMAESIYSKICASYFSAASDLHGIQMRTLLAAHLNLVKKPPEDELDQGFSPVPAPLTGKGTVGIRRAGTLIRSPIEGRQRDREKQSSGDLRASEAFGMFLEQLVSLIYHEDDFIRDLLHINDAGLTFADYMGLDNYFCRQAARSASLSSATMKLVRGALDLIFGFIPAELKSWLDGALARDRMEIVGIIVSLERFLIDAEEKGNPFVLGLLEKQHSRLKLAFDRHINDQLQSIERTKLSSKKRKGVTYFVKYFSTYAARIEQQLIGANELEIRMSVDSAYERIVQAMFDSLKQIAKLDGEGEDKGQLNYHVILIENMHYFVAEISQLDVPSLTASSRRAEGIYDESLAAYIKIVFRRPFGKIIDFFEALDRAVKDSNPAEVTNNSNYNKAALRRIIKDYNSKDIRKHVDTLSKRVEKHFTESSEKTTMEEVSGIAAGTVLVGVWKACEKELVKLTELFSYRISQWYGDSGVSLEYTTSDIETAFRKQRLGP